MKKLLILFVTLMGPIGIAQVNPVDFEPGGIGADWTWTVFENDTNPPLEFVANPDTSGINASSTVAKFTALDLGQPFAGCESMHGSDVGTFTLTPDNAYVSIMVYKSVISDVGFKFATPAGASTGEIKIPNTLTDQWERIVFDFTGIIGQPSSNGIDQIIVFPDFQDRSSDNIVYFDNIVFGDSSLLGTNSATSLSFSMFPNPAADIIRIQAAELMEEVRVLNSLGQLISTVSPNENSLELDVSGFSTGLYFIAVTGNGQQTVKRLLVK